VPRAVPVALALAVAGRAATLTGALQTGTTGTAEPNPAAVRAAGTGAVAAAFGYPHRCLSITISPTDRDYASAHVDHRGQCARYHGYVNASFHRIDGVWRLVLDEGQLFVPNRLLAPSHSASAGKRASSGYPTGCLSVGVALHDPRFGRPDFDRTLACPPAGGQGGKDAGLGTAHHPQCPACERRGSAAPPSPG
jgi:hypothetical protein